MNLLPALKAIANEIKTNPDLVKGAPYTRPVGRLDEVAAARKPNLRWRWLSLADRKNETTMAKSKILAEPLVHDKGK